MGNFPVQNLMSELKFKKVIWVIFIRFFFNFFLPIFSRYTSSLKEAWDELKDNLFTGANKAFFKGTKSCIFCQKTVNSEYFHEINNYND